MQIFVITEQFISLNCGDLCLLLSYYIVILLYCRLQSTKLQYNDPFDPIVYICPADQSHLTHPI
jgi:hypothetical protein